MSRASWCRVAAALVVTLLIEPGVASADDGVREASRHFQHGVALYGETDYRAALVEFKRAYASSPNVSVLYNVGETQFQLQDYAGALTTFERFLAEVGTSDSHRTEVESNVEILRSRVGHISVSTVPSGADITIDDQPAGRTPFDRALLVGIGHRKVVAALPGRPAVTKYVDVATDDNLSIALVLADAATPLPPPQAASARTTLPITPPVDETPSHAGSTWRAIGWTTTGVLAAGAIVMGVLADKASNDLVTARSSYPVSSSTLAHDSSLTFTYGVTADSLAIGAVVVGSLTLISTLVGSASPPSRRGQLGTPAPAVAIGPGGLDVTF